MFTHLTLKNFQAWSSLSLPLSEVTVIVGETNGGKSSILRALTCVLYNALEGTGMVRSGASQAEVTLEGAGFVVRWQRGEKVNRYELNGQVFDKVGRAVPEPVMTALGIRPLEHDGESVRLQWAPQMGAPFLIGDSGAKATRMLGSAGQAALVAQAAKLAAGEVKKQTDLAEATRGLMTKSDEELTALQWVIDAAPLAATLEAAVLEADRLTRRLDAVRAARETLTTFQAHSRQAQQTLETAETQRARLVMVVATLTRAERAEACRQRGLELAAASQRVSLAEDVRQHMQQIVRCTEQQEAIERLRQTAAAMERASQAAAHAERSAGEHRAAYQALRAAVTCATCGQVREGA